MSTTKQKIITTAIDLFNQQGLSNVRVQDIAEAMSISPGNLTYHYKTKKDLLGAIYEHMKHSLKGLRNQKGNNYDEDLDLTHRYMLLQLRFRFFYRDTLDIIDLLPSLKDAYRKQFDAIVTYNKKVIDHAVTIGRMHPETTVGHYDLLAENAWAVLHAWLAKRSILGESHVNVYDGLRASLALYTPYLTKKGMDWFQKNEQIQSILIKNELIMN